VRVTTSKPEDPDSRVVTFEPRKASSQRKPSRAPVEDLRNYERAGDDGPDDYRHRMIMNVLAGVVLVFLVLAGWWIADSMAQLRKNQDCVLSGKRNCAPIDAPVEPR
jgi:hypothetical protein